MKIAFYHCVLPEAGRKPGGVAVFVDRLATALTEAGHDVTVFTYERPAAARPYRIRTLWPARAARNALVRQYVAPWLFNVRPFTQQFDVVHLHGDDWFYWRRKVPTVRTFYGSAVFEAAAATSWKRRLNSSLIFALELVASRQADAVYGIGADSRALFAADGILGFGVAAPTPADDPERTQSVILFVGTWEGRKRGKLLHDVFVNQIRPAIPDAQLWMVSDRAEEGPGITWLDRPSDERLIELYRQATVFCLPSTYEGLGIPYIEAMAHRVPVVATPNLGAIEVLAGGRFGLLVEADQLGSALLDVLTDAALRNRLAEASGERAKRFEWSKIIPSYEAAYALAIDRYRRARLEP